LNLTLAKKGIHYKNGIGGGVEGKIPDQMRKEHSKLRGGREALFGQEVREKKASAGGIKIYISQHWKEPRQKGRSIPSDGYEEKKGLKEVSAERGEEKKEPMPGGEKAVVLRSLGQVFRIFKKGGKCTRMKKNKVLTKGETLGEKTQ